MLKKWGNVSLTSGVNRAKIAPIDQKNVAYKKGGNLNIDPNTANIRVMLQRCSGSNWYQASPINLYLIKSSPHLINKMTKDIILIIFLGCGLYATPK